MDDLQGLQSRFLALRTIDILQSNAECLARLPITNPEQRDIIESAVVSVLQAITELENLP